jgi:hypothetical protein
MATEPIFASVSNTLGCFDNVGRVPKELKGMVRSDTLFIVFYVPRLVVSATMYSIVH